MKDRLLNLTLAVMVLVIALGYITVTILLTGS